MKVLLLDAYNLIYRAKSGFTKGENYVIYNFFRGLRPLVEKFKPDLVYFVLEGKPKHRLALSEGVYKANRNNNDLKFHEQKASIIEAVKHYLPFISVRHPDFECDDVISTYVIEHTKRGDECFVISSDSDFIQLHNICEFTLYNPVKKINIPKPDYDYVTWKALRGDATDNIKGIPGVGDKTATKLVNNKELLNEFLQDESKLNIFRKNVNLIRLVNLIDFESDFELHAGKLNSNDLKSYFSELEFDSMLKEKTWDKYIKTFKEVKSEYTR